jgi:hypothetical protein
MITSVGRGTPEPAPRLTPQGSGAPQFAVQFSRPGRPESRANNTFRWTGPGTIHVLERGLLVLTRRRSPLGFRTTDERFIPASDICEVFRDGDAVRVDLRGESKTAGFFQFWTGNPAIAGTIVRLLPTTRTIEYEVTPADQVTTSRPPLSLPRRRRVWRRYSKAAFAFGFTVLAVLLVTDIVMWQTRRVVSVPTVNVTLPVPAGTPAERVPILTATPEEISSALADIRRFDDRMEGLRTQYRSASLALQGGQLSPTEFVDGLNHWLIPQWRALYGELAASRPAGETLAARVHARLGNAALFWERGLQDYAEGLKTNSPAAVMAAFDLMSSGNESRHDAWRLLESSELHAAAPPASGGASHSPRD